MNRKRVLVDHADKYVCPAALAAETAMVWKNYAVSTLRGEIIQFLLHEDVEGMKLQARVDALVKIAERFSVVIKPEPVICSVDEYDTNAVGLIERLAMSLRMTESFNLVDQNDKTHLMEQNEGVFSWTSKRYNQLPMLFSSKDDGETFISSYFTREEAKGLNVINVS